KAFEYWVLGYFYRVDSFLKPDLVRVADSIYVDKHLEHPVSFMAIKRSPSNDHNVNLRRDREQIEACVEKIDDFINLDFSVEAKQIWKNNNLPKQAKDDLKLLELVYSQYKNMLPLSWREQENCVQLFV